MLSRPVSCRTRGADARRGSPRRASGAPPSTALRPHLRPRSHPAAGLGPLHRQLEQGFPQGLPEVHPYAPRGRWTFYQIPPYSRGRRSALLPAGTCRSLRHSLGPIPTAAGVLHHSPDHRFGRTGLPLGQSQPGKAQLWLFVPVAGRNGLVAEEKRQAAWQRREARGAVTPPCRKRIWITSARWPSQSGGATPVVLEADQRGVGLDRGCRRLAVPALETAHQDARPLARANAVLRRIQMRLSASSRAKKMHRFDADV